MDEIPRSLDLFAVIIFLGVVQGLFLSIFFLNKRVRTKPSNRFLGFLMLILSLVILEIFLVHTGYMLDMVWINNFSEPLTLGIAPLMYFYIFASITRNSPKRVWLHLIPLFLWALYCIPYFIEPLELKHQAYLIHLYPEVGNFSTLTEYKSDPLRIRPFFLQITMLQLFIYLIISLIFIGKTFRALNISFLARKKPPISWLRNFILLMFVLLISAGFASSFLVIDMGMYIVGSTTSLIIYATSFNVIRASDFFQESASDPFSPRKKYEKSALQEEEMDQILSGLKKCMEEDKDYKNHLLSLAYIAKKLNTSVHNISQVVNVKLDQTFYEMIASYRVNEAKSMLLDAAQTNYTIEDIADEVGYNSKSSFNRSFKKIEGLTPSEFRDRYRKS